MTRKERGLVDAVVLAALNAPHVINGSKIVLEFDRSQPGLNATNQLHLRIEAALTSLQSAAEGLEEALKLIRNHSSVSVHQIEIIDAALAAWRNIAEFKEKQQ